MSARERYITSIISHGAPREAEERPGPHGCLQRWPREATLPGLITETNEGTRIATLGVSVSEEKDEIRDKNVT